MSRRVKRKASKSVSALFIIAAIVALVAALYPNVADFFTGLFDQPRKPTVVDGELSVHFLDVDQGDCILVIAPDGESMLIDTSVSKQDDVIIEYIRACGIEKLDCMVLTHPDADHIGSATSILNEIGAKTVYMTDMIHTTKTFETLLETIDRLDIPLKIPKVNDIIELGDARFTVLGPVNKTDNKNEMSIVMRLDYGKHSFMLTGDAGHESEEDMLDKHSLSSFKCDVLKIGHHGSSTSSSKEFVLAVKPSYAIISCGRDNSYGHPHDETVELLSELDIPYFITYEVGHIVFTTDGETLTLERPSSKG